MRIITISNDRYTRGSEIAEKVASAIGYECVSRQIILSASKAFDVSETDLIKAIKEPPAILKMFSRERQRYMAYIKSTVADYMLKHDMVYHGLVGHPVIRGVSHVLKVRLIANLEARIGLEMDRENISKDQARKRIADIDEEKKRWGKAVYGMDITNPMLYDLTINVGHLNSDDIDDAVGIIISMASHNKFQPNTYSINCMKNIALACRVRAVFIAKDPAVRITADKGTVYILTKTLKNKTHSLGQTLKEEALKIEGVEHVEIYNNKGEYIKNTQGR